MQSTDNLIIRSKNVCTPSGIMPACVNIQNGRISSIAGYAESAKSEFTVDDVGDLFVIPGIVDSHVHVNEPGRTEWEGFETATRAAAAGGITTIVDMPLNCIPVTTTLEAFREKLQAVTDKLYVDCAFYGGVVPGNLQSLDALIDAGVVGFKCFLIHSGIDDFPNVSEEDLREAMPVLAKRRVPLLVHAELDAPPLSGGAGGAAGSSAERADSSGAAQEESRAREKARQKSKSKEKVAVLEDPRQYQRFLDSRPGRWEIDAIRLMISLCEQYNCPVHIVHLSCADAVDMIARARADNMRITVETCPHYLTFASEEIADGDTRFKCAPPIRQRENRERLWEALKNRHIDFIVSDHSPCTPELKLLRQGDFDKAWGGISSLQFGLSAIWTEAQQRGFSLEQVIRWMSTNPAKFTALSKKGALEPGKDADIVVFDPDASFEVRPDNVLHRHKVTPHEGRRLKGVVRATYLRGLKIFEDGRFLVKPCGKALRN